ncbi:hypothetical protein [Rhodocyclus tenuis]|uniref:Uncharacterized protein n=1 Tax=Rhodocyclus tenuis TaxID=1066 RepID=A0A840GJT8_RHOTE|nr:hypothetical protein [Rhodocyclus tenuis]MBB4248702.1 hypothetical protein [Rhodocyclus tenuis]
MKRLLGKLRRGKPARSVAGKARTGTWRERLSGLRRRLTPGEKPRLLLAWDFGQLEAALLSGKGESGEVLATASSRQASFAAALDEVLAALARQTLLEPRRVVLAARALQPAIARLPVSPEKPRPAAQMRELLQSELEPVLAEFGAIWSVGALLEANGYISPQQRQQILAHEVARREQRLPPLRFGELALDMELIERETLDRCIEEQQALQHLDATIVSGWCGRIVEERPLWLACGVGSSSYREWQEALAEHKLRLEACLPLAWLVSEAASPGSASEPGAAATIALELHREEVVAVHRQAGQVLETRNEGRMERALQTDWLCRLIADWGGDTRTQLELVCVYPEDAGAAALCDELLLCTGHPTRLRQPQEVWRDFWPALARAAFSRTPQLPRIVDRELRGSPWKDHDVRRLAALGLVVVVLAGIEGVQQFSLQRLDAQLEERARVDREKSLNSQREATFNSELKALASDLESSRKQLEPLLNDRERLSTITAMRHNLPDLLLALAQAVGGDAVLEGLRNSKQSSNASSMQVVAWSPSYTAAQDFVNRTAELTGALGYGVAQTEIVERKGRNGRSGHEVSFWLVLDGDDLEGEARTPEASRRAAPPAPSTGISAVTPASRP